MIKLNKVVLKNVSNVAVMHVEKVDNRVNNTGRPVNKKSNRQLRLNKQALYASLNEKFITGNQFKIHNETYSFSQTGKELGIIKSNVTGYVCNVNYIGRTKVQGFTFVLGKQVKIELNLKTLKFVS